MQVYGIGYEKSGLSDFIAVLKEAGIGLVVDVRERSQSRRAGFSKRQLAASLDEAGINYLHLRALGTPPEGRAAHHTGDEATFHRVYEEQLAKPEAQQALIDLAEAAARQPVCLVCYEADWRQCHRARIFAELEKRGFSPAHLIVEERFA